ncbi:MAG: hypothetical protein K2Q34_08425 [Alphaproteobacteria bacterium]|nr:hypothetical protein [Alphaproteobacteria bacterium]PPD54031.1 MAG: hypothetical protein CTY12_04090 [Methylotenera sp.]
MTIPFDHHFTKVNSSTRLDSKLLNNGKEWIAWWYVGIVKNKLAETQPHVLVAFREVLADGLSEEVFHQKIQVTMLGQVKIGSVWKDGFCIKQAQFEHEIFDVDFTYRTWQTNSFKSASADKKPAPFIQSIYPLEYQSNDRTWLLEFSLSTGGKLVIPCLEYFARCYGCSGELKRVLVTYPWEDKVNINADTALKRLYAPLDEGEVDDGSVWKVKLKQRLYNGDVIFLAHAKYDKAYTGAVIKQIYTSIFNQYDASKPDRPIFTKIAPWFQGDAQLSVKGIWFDNRKSFLALNILGGSEPNGVLIERDRTNTNKTNIPADVADAGKAWNGAPARILTPPQIIDLTGNLEPDHGAPIIEVQDPSYVILGKPREIKDVVREKAKSSKGELTNGAEATVFATGDAYSSEKDVGYASIHAKNELESNGALRDMWNAMLYFQQKYPKQIKSVEWFTFDNGYQDNGEPNLIALNPFSKETGKDLEGEIRNWPYFDTRSLQRRGILVSRIGIDGQFVYIVEIQRRPRSVENEDGIAYSSEESYTGFIFKAESQQEVEEVIKYFMNRIRYVKGIVKNLLRDCPVSMASAFQHKSAGFETIPCEAAVLNALGKVNITIG